MSLIADVVFASAAAAFAHFGLTYDAPDREPPQVERSVARSKVKKAQPTPNHVDDCLDKKPAIHRI